MTGAYNAAVSEPELTFSGSAADIFAGPLPSSEAPVSAPLDAYQLKSQFNNQLGIWINAGDNTLYQSAVYNFSTTPVEVSASKPPLVSGPGEDFAGTTRPLDAIDLGAYERE
jgi:hypothetical protein